MLIKFRFALLFIFSLVLRISSAQKTWIPSGIPKKKVKEVDSLYPTAQQESWGLYNDVTPKTFYQVTFTFSKQDYIIVYDTTCVRTYTRIHIPDSLFSPTISQYIKQNYSQYLISEKQRSTDLNGVQTIRVALYSKKGDKCLVLFFDLSGKFIKEGACDPALQFSN